MIDFLATRAHFRDHLRPVWGALHPSVRGRFMDAIEPGPRAPFVLAAAYEDARHARTMGYTRQAFLEHGIGQSYLGVKNGSYAGGRDRTGTELFLVPNDHAARRWQTAYPRARVEIVGSPKLDDLPRRHGDAGEVVAVSHHWFCGLVPETRPVFQQFQRAIVELSKHYTVIGHGHPRIIDWLAKFYERNGIEVVSDFADVCRRADVFVADNTSSLYEFASTNRPVVVLNGRGYRRNVNHGLRFWEAASVGFQVDDPALLGDAVAAALDDPPGQQRDREAALAIVYGLRTNGAAAAATALTDWMADVAVAA